MRWASFKGETREEGDASFAAKAVADADAGVAAGAAAEAAQAAQAAEAAEAAEAANVANVAGALVGAARIPRARQQQARRAAKHKARSATNSQPNAHREGACGLLFYVFWFVLLFGIFA